MFVEKGVAAASVESIAEAAGYTRGAFYSNFEGKAEVLRELLQRDHDQAQANLSAIIEGGGTYEQMRARVIALYSRYLRNHECSVLWIEAGLIARRDATFQKYINDFRHEKFDQVSAYIRAASRFDGSPILVQVDALAFTLVSLCEGVQFSIMSAPQEMSEGVLQEVLAGFFASALCRQREETQTPVMEH